VTEDDEEEVVITEEYIPVQPAMTKQQPQHHFSPREVGY
jgi:hypothetical protein